MSAGPSLADHSSTRPPVVVAATGGIAALPPNPTRLVPLLYSTGGPPPPARRQQHSRLSLLPPLRPRLPSRSSLSTTATSDCRACPLSPQRAPSPPPLCGPFVRLPPPPQISRRFLSPYCPTYPHRQPFSPSLVRRKPGVLRHGFVRLRRARSRV
ncbi:unnamed protein product, partial [Sphacelaria rigidula]